MLPLPRDLLLTQYEECETITTDGSNFEISMERMLDHVVLTYCIIYGVVTW
jgi:hypothetical protein